MFNREGKKSWQLLAILLSFCICFTSIPAMAFAAEDEENDKSQVGSDEPTNYLDPEKVTEEEALLGKSGKDYTTFDLGGSKRYTVFHGEDVRYEDAEGNLIDYNPELEDLSEDNQTKKSMKGYVYKNKAGDCQHYIPEQISETTPLVMEKNGYQITMTPTEKTYKDFFGKQVKVKKEKQKITDVYKNKKDKALKATFKDSSALAYLEYTSLNDGVKEDIVLTKRPAKNTMDFQIKAGGLTPKLSEEDGSIGFYNEKDDMPVCIIAPPNMNDASGNAYSEDASYQISAKEGEADTYILDICQYFGHKKSNKYYATWRASSSIC